MRRIRTGLFLVVVIISLLLPAGTTPATAQEGVQVCEREVSPLIETYNANIGELPGFAADLVTNKIVHGEIESGPNQYYTIVTDGDGRVQNFTAGEPENPTLIVETDCETVTRVIDANDSAAIAVEEYQNGEIAIGGTGPINTVVIEATEFIAGVADWLGFV